MLCYWPILISLEWSLQREKKIQSDSENHRVVSATSNPICPLSVLTGPHLPAPGIFKLDSHTAFTRLSCWAVWDSWVKFRPHDFPCPLWMWSSLDSSSSEATLTVNTYFLTWSLFHVWVTAPPWCWVRGRYLAFKTLCHLVRPGVFTAASLDSPHRCQYYPPSYDGHARPKTLLTTPRAQGQESLHLDAKIVQKNRRISKLENCGLKCIFWIILDNQYKDASVNST